MPLLDIPDFLLRDAKLYAPGRDDLGAVCHVLEDYPRLAGEVRQLKRRIAQLDEEGSLLDDRLEALQAACRAILEL
jgi:cell division protein FtsB